MTTIPRRTPPRTRVMDPTRRLTRHLAITFRLINTSAIPTRDAANIARRLHLETAYVTQLLRLLESGGMIEPEMTSAGVEWGPKSDGTISERVHEFARWVRDERPRWRATAPTTAPNGIRPGWRDDTRV